MSRQELIKRVQDICFEDGETINYISAERIVNFLIAREREQIDKVVEPLRMYRDEWIKQQDIGWTQEPNHKIIDLSLAIADEIMKG